MFTGAHAVLKSSIPQTLDVLGMEQAAGDIRNSDPQDIMAIVMTLRRLPPELKDVAFWAEAVLWASVDGRVEDLKHHRRMLLWSTAVLLNSFPRIHLAPQ